MDTYSSLKKFGNFSGLDYGLDKKTKERIVNAIDFPTTDKGTFKCKVCGSEHRTWTDLIRHDLTRSKRPDHNSSGFFWRCRLCNKNFSTPQIAFSHLRNECENRDQLGNLESFFSKHDLSGTFVNVA